MKEVLDLIVKQGTEFEKIGMQFQCSHAVYVKGGDSSICYVTSEGRAKTMVEAFDRIAELEAQVKHLQDRLTHANSNRCADGP